MFKFSSGRIAKSERRRMLLSGSNYGKGIVQFVMANREFLDKVMGMTVAEIVDA